MTSIERGEAGVEFLGATALMRFARVLRLLAPDDAGFPGQRPKAVELDALLVDAGGMRGIALEGPGAAFGVEIGEQPVGRVLRGRAAGEPAGDRRCGRAGHDVADLLAV